MRATYTIDSNQINLATPITIQPTVNKFIAKSYEHFYFPSLMICFDYINNHLVEYFENNELKIDMYFENGLNVKFTLALVDKFLCSETNNDSSDEYKEKYPSEMINLCQRNYHAIRDFPIEEGANGRIVLFMVDYKHVRLPSIDAINISTIEDLNMSQMILLHNEIPVSTDIINYIRITMLMLYK